jgi:uncharacterized protein YjdB
MKKQVKRFVYLLLSVMLLATTILGFCGPASATTQVPLSSLSAGNTVTFAGQTWIVLDPSTGYLLMQGPSGNLAFDSTGVNTFNPSSSTNVAYYLNNPTVNGGVYGSMSSADQALIQTHTWTTGGETNESSGSVDAKIGLLSYSEYNTYKSVTGVVNSGLIWWTRTPCSGNSGDAWIVNTDGFLYGAYLANLDIAVRPALYLNSAILVSGDSSHTVTPTAPTNITAVSLTGVVAPVTGATPEASGSLTSGNSPEYTVTSVEWENSDGSPATLNGSGNFIAGSAYQVGITLTSATGYDFPTSGLTPTVDVGMAGAGTGYGTGHTSFDFLVTFPATVDKSALATAITNANTLIGSVTVGTAAGDVSQANHNTYLAAIGTAQAVNSNTSATQAAVIAAVTTLASATTVFNGDVISAITISPATPLIAWVGQSYSQTMTASGGTAPYVWGANGFDGLTFSSAGVWSGTPTTSGGWGFTMDAKDAKGYECRLDYVLDVDVHATGVTLNKSTDTINTGGTDTLVATVQPSDATNKTVAWSSDNTGAATVDNGVVTPVGAGTATITVTTADGSKTATCDVTVTAATVSVTGVTLDQSTLALTAGGAIATLTPTIAPDTATNTNVTWSTSDDTVATVDNGVVTPVGAGTATITVTTADGSKTATCDMTVTAATVISSGGGVAVSYKPAVQTEAATVVTATSSALNGDITSNNGYAVTDYGFLWGTSSSSLTNKLDVGTDNHSGAFTDTLSSLTAGTTYYFQAYATNSYGTADGAVMSFTAGASQTTPTTPTTPTAPTAPVFSDVSASYWGYDAISSLSSKGIVSGYPDGTFKPDASITRAEFATIVVKALGLNTTGTTGQFTDVTADAWYYGTVNAAASAGLVSGMGDNLFAPNALITREQMAVMVAKALGNKAPAVDGTELNAFSDKSAVSSWAVSGMEEAVKAGIVSGMTADTLAPMANATRAQAAEMIYKMLAV